MEIISYIVMLSIILALIHYRLRSFAAYTVKFIALIMMFSVKRITFNDLFIVIGVAVLLPFFNQLIPLLHIKDETISMVVLIWFELIILIMVYLIVLVQHQAKKINLFSAMLLLLGFFILYVVYVVAILNGVVHIIFKDIDFQRVLDIIRTFIIPFAFNGYMIAFGLRLWLSTIKPKPIEKDPYELNIMNKPLL